MEVRQALPLADLEDQYDIEHHRQPHIQLDLRKLTPAERIRYFSRFSSPSGDVMEYSPGSSYSSLGKRTRTGSNSSIANHEFPYRSSIIDNYLRFQMDSTEDNMISDIRKLVDLQSRLKVTIDLINSQLEKANDNCQKVLTKSHTNEAKNALSASESMDQLDTNSTLRISTKVQGSSVAAFIQHTDNIPLAITTI